MRVTRYDTRLTQDKIPMLVKDFAYNYCIKNGNTTESIVSLIKDAEKVETLDHECVWLVCENNAGKIIGYFKISEGSVNCSIVSIREIFIKALAVGAVRIILVHNHPSGDVCPSLYDDDVTQNTKKAGDLLGVVLLDHIIIGGGENGNYYSYCKEGRM